MSANLQKSTICGERKVINVYENTTCINFDKIKFHSGTKKIYFSKKIFKKQRLCLKKPRPFLKNIRPFFNETSQNFHKALTFFHKISPIFSQKRHFCVLNLHKSHKKCSISPDFLEILIVQNVHICPSPDFRFQIRDSRGIS